MDRKLNKTFCKILLFRVYDCFCFSNTLCTSHTNSSIYSNYIQYFIFYKICYLIIMNGLISIKRVAQTAH